MNRARVVLGVDVGRDLFAVPGAGQIGLFVTHETVVVALRPGGPREEQKQQRDGDRHRSARAGGGRRHGCHRSTGNAAGLVYQKSALV